jgi:hypothetical protein
MPRKGDPLSAEQIATSKRWIDEGAEWPDSASVKLDKRVDHWAFKPPVKVPKVRFGRPAAKGLNSGIPSMPSSGLVWKRKASSLLRRLLPEVLVRRLASRSGGLAA